MMLPLTASDAISLEQWQDLPSAAWIRHSHMGLPSCLPESDSVTSSDNVASPAPNTKSKKTKQKKPGWNNRHSGEVKYGVHVPNNVKKALLLDKENGDNLWTDVIANEINSLKALGCFKLDHCCDWNWCTKGYQYAPLRLVFDVKPSGLRKARLVCGGNVIKTDLNTYASTVKSLSVRLINWIATANKLEVLCGDVGNAFANAYTQEMVFTMAGPEFGSAWIGKHLIIVNALYGMRTSAERWRSHFAQTLRSMGFIASCSDQDVWFCGHEDKSGYDYICTHVDDFKIVAKDPWKYMKIIQSQYIVKDIGPPLYYLDNDYFVRSDGFCYVGSSTYVKEALRQVQDKFGELTKECSPAPRDDHPELDESSLCTPEETRIFQGLIGTAQWIVLLGRMDISQAVTSLNHFNAAPRQGYLARAFQIFGYLKRYKHRCIQIDPQPPMINHGLLATINPPDFTNIYPDACEENDSKLPEPLGEELDITAILDADHAHDNMMRCCITEILLFFRQTLVQWISK
jgi:hypothetical protein